LVDLGLSGKNFLIPRNFPCLFRSFLGPLLFLSQASILVLEVYFFPAELPGLFRRQNSSQNFQFLYFPLGRFYPLCSTLLEPFPKFCSSFWALTIGFQPLSFLGIVVLSWAPPFCLLPFGARVWNLPFWA